MGIFDIIKLLTHPSKIKLIIDIINLLKELFDKISELDDSEESERDKLIANKLN